MKWLTFILLLITSSYAHSQQQGVFNFTLNNPFLNNPSRALFNLNSKINLSLNYKKQWLNGVSIYEYQNASFNMPILNDRAGIGANLTREQYHLFVRTHGSISGSGMAINTDKFNLAAGASFGFMVNSINYSDIIADDLTDKLLQVQNENLASFDASIGILLMGWEKKFQTDFVIRYITPSNENTISFNPDILLSSRYIFDFGKTDSIKNPAYLIPIIGVKFMGANQSIMMDIAFTTGIYFNQLKNYGISLTIGSRMGEKFRNANMFFGLNSQLSKHINIGYIFELPVGSINSSDLVTHLGTSHEIQLRLTFDNLLKNKVDTKKAFRLIKENKDSIEVISELTDSINQQIFTIKTQIEVIVKEVQELKMEDNAQKSELKNLQKAIKDIRLKINELEKLGVKVNTLHDLLNNGIKYKIDIDQTIQNQ